MENHFMSIIISDSGHDDVRNVLLYERITGGEYGDTVERNDGTKILHDKQQRVESNEVVEIAELNAQKELLF